MQHVAQESLMVEAAARHKRAKSKDKESSSLQQAVEIRSLLVGGSFVATDCR